MPPSLDSPAVFDYADRQRRLAQRMEAEAVDVLFLGPSADLEYLTGVERQIPNFGEAAYANGWVAGAFLRPGADPIFVFPRMFAAFDLREEPEGELVIVIEALKIGFDKRMISPHPLGQYRFAPYDSVENLTYRDGILRRDSHGLRRRRILGARAQQRENTND